MYTKKGFVQTKPFFDDFYLSDFLPGGFSLSLNLKLFCIRTGHFIRYNLSVCISLSKILPELVKMNAYSTSNLKIISNPLSIVELFNSKNRNRKSSYSSFTSYFLGF